jgi:hypothetical protein
MLGVGLKRLALRIVPRSVVRWQGSDRDYFLLAIHFISTRIIGYGG